MKKQLSELVEMQQAIELNTPFYYIEKELFEEKLHNNYQHSLDIIEFLPDAIFVVDRDRKVIAWNQAMEEMTGVRKEEIIGKGDYAYAVPFYGKPRPILIDLVFSNDQETERKYEYVERKGTKLYAETFIPLPFSGDEVFLWMTASPLFDSYGNLVGAIESIRDITQRKRAEEVLKTERQRLYSLLDRLPAIVCLIAPDYSIRFANHYFRKRFGEPEGRTCHEVYRGYNAPCKECLTYRVFETNVPQEWEWTSLDNRTYQIYDYPFTDIDGSPLVLELEIDITERKQAVEELRLSEERFSKAFNASPSIMSIIKLTDTRFLDVNDSFISSTDYYREEIIGRTLTELNLLVDPRDYGKLKQLIREQGVIHNLEINFRMKSGKVQVGLLSVEIIELGGERCLLAVVNDITKRKQAEELFRTLTNSSPVGIYIVQDGNFQFVNPLFRKYTGYSEDELLGMDPLEFVVPDDRKMVRENAIMMLKGKCSSPYEYRVTTKDGETWWVMEKVTSIQYQGKRAVLGNCVDITWRKQAEKMLRSSEERFSKAFNAGPYPMSINSITDGRFIDVNNRFLCAYGYSRQEVIGRTTTELNIFEDPAENSKIKQTVQKQGSIHNLEVKFRSKSGELKLGLFSAEAIELNNELCMLCVMNDITELKQIEKEMARLERLNLVGEMAAGIGHEIRNPMTTIRGFLQMLDRKKEYVKHKEYFNLMIGELDRANSIITEFLSMAKNKPVDLKPQSINHIVQTLFPLIQADALNVDKYIEVELVEIPDLLLDEKEIRQLILNLVRNGLEAMSAGGKLTIRTFLDDEEVVVLSVQDQGPGIKNEILEKIGTPFFTTKDTGTGLGLAVCYSIAARHNATIDIETSLDGTTFFVRFRAVNSTNNMESSIEKHYI